jgi:hypothetical protein
MDTQSFEPIYVYSTANLPKAFAANYTAPSSTVLASSFDNDFLAQTGIAVTSTFVVANVAQPTLSPSPLPSPSPSPSPSQSIKGSSTGSCVVVVAGGVACCLIFAGVIYSIRKSISNYFAADPKKSSQVYVTDESTQQASSSLTVPSESVGENDLSTPPGLTMSVITSAQWASSSST